MIDLKLWKTILNYIEEYKTRIKTSGILICGSFAGGKLREGSDIDILFLQDEYGFQMEIIPAGRFPIDRLQAKAELLHAILEEKTELSDVLSLSFGGHNIVVEESQQLSEIITAAEKNITERSLSYNPPADKEPHIADGSIYTVSKKDSLYHLLKNGTFVL